MSETKQYPVVPVFQPTLFSRLFFSRCGWVVCLPAYPIFCCLLYDATWCQKYCLLPTVIALWNVQMLGQCQLITAIADQWQAKNIWRKFVFFGPTYPTFFQDIKPEPHIFCNVLWTSEKCRPIGNVQIWLEFFSTSFRFQASAVLVNQVNMFLNWTNTVLFIYFLTFYESLPAHVEKRFCTATGAYFWVWSRCASNERSSFQTTLRTYINLTRSLTEKPHLHMTASPNFSLSKHLLTFHYQSTS